MTHPVRLFKGLFRQPGSGRGTACSDPALVFRGFAEAVERRVGASPRPKVRVPVGTAAR